MSYIVGLDEAGRGAVVGPMIVAMVAVDIAQDAKEWSAISKRLKDSKKLTPNSRLRLYNEMQTLSSFASRIYCVLPEKINSCNLNTLELNAFGKLVELASTEFFPSKVYMDALGGVSQIPDILRKLHLSTGVKPSKLLMEPGADAKYPIVSAASIVAKHCRDRLISYLSWTDPLYEKLGSGYPGDATTKTWLEGLVEKGIDWPEQIRTKWSTIKDLDATRIRT